MMLNKGRHGSRQVLSRATVELMTDQVTAAHDGFAGTTEGIQGLLDAGVWGNGIGDTRYFFGPPRTSSSTSQICVSTQ